MCLATVEVFNTKFDVYYDSKYQRDIYGTGDSPDAFEITINEIETEGDTQDISELLANFVVEQIRVELVKIEAEKL